MKQGPVCGADSVRALAQSSTNPIAPQIKSVNDYRICMDQQIGKGGFALVYKGYLASDPEKLLAIKVID